MFARYDLFFPLDNQIARIFFSMKRLTALSVVTCVTHGWVFVQTKRGKLAAFLKMVFDQERLYLDIMSHIRLGKHVWVWLVNEDDWARRLGHYIVGFNLGLVDWAIILWVSVCRGLLVGGFGPQPMVPTMPPFSRLGRLFFPSREKRIFGTCLMWG